MKAVWAIRNSLGLVIRQDVLEEGVRPVLDLEAQETASIIDYINDAPDTKATLEQLIESATQAANTAKDAIMTDGIVRSALLKRAGGLTVTAAEKQAALAAEAALKAVDAKLELYIVEIRAALDGDGIPLPVF